MVLLNNKNRSLSRLAIYSILRLIMSTDSTHISRRIRLSIFLENVLYIGAAIVLAALIQSFVVRPFIVSGSSMEPNIEDKQYLIVDEISYRIHSPQRGDIVVLKSPPEPTKYYIKRIIGLPGETITVSNNKVIIANAQHPNGFTLDEPYILDSLNQNSGLTMSVTIPQDQYFVLGDNRDGSYDSRSWGLLPKENIRGRALLRLLPLTKLNYLPGSVSYDQSN
jgi:signal peptidase I